ncbi:arylamine N-acetyltransferase [Streptomyces albidoflavus]
MPMDNTADRQSEQWEAHQLDIDAYLRRVDYAGPFTDALAVLCALHRSHKTAIAFENIDVVLGRDISLALPDIQRKLLHSGRGGYCFEHNLLYAAALERLGLTVTRLLARVRQGRPTVRYRAHTTLLVAVAGQLFLTDVGFGAEGLPAPLPLIDGATVNDGDFSWRLRREEDQWVLQTLHDDGWFDLYAFRLERHYAVDFEVSNYYTAHHERSTFTGKLIAMRGDGRAQHTLVNSTLTTRHGDGRTELVQLTGDGVIHTLHETFGIRLNECDARMLRERLSTTFSSPRRHDGSPLARKQETAQARSAAGRGGIQASWSSRHAGP